MKTTGRLDQRGVASILITMIMMIVITLIVIGFAQVTQRNQRESLDRQLSTQAYYAAETGVNDTIKKLQADPSLLSGTGSCNSSSSFITTAGLTGSQTLNDANNVKYTCVTVSGTPTTLTSHEIKVNDSWVIPITPSSGTGGLTISWGTTGLVCPASHGGAMLGFGRGSDPCSARGAPVVSNCEHTGRYGLYFPPTTNYSCPYGDLRIDLYQYDPSVPGSGGINAADQTAGLANNIATVYLAANYTPSRTPVGVGPGNIVSFGATVTPSIILANCDTTSCSTILHASPDFGSSGMAYYARVSSYYRAGENVTIGAAGGGVSFSGGQAVIDVTGKAGDELRRIQVRVPLSTASAPPIESIPDYGLSSNQPICKDPRPELIIAYNCDRTY